MSGTANIPLSSTCVTRILKDVKNIYNNSLNSNGIYYFHSDTDILSGKALIIGPSDTPYEFGFYFFEVSFPTQYPFEPPIFKFSTCDGNTRFNPNLYKSGKVCLSILNTWSGEQWSSCQNLSSVLLTLCTILNEEPFLNEPGVTINHNDYDNYNKIILYKNFDFAICGILNNDNRIKDKFHKFIPIINKFFIDNYHLIIEKINKSYIQPCKLNTSIYDMNCYINYDKTIEKLKHLYSFLIKLK